MTPTAIFSRIRLITTAICIIISMLMSATAHATLYKCKGPDGRHSYVNDPDSCPQGSTRLIIPGTKKSPKQSVKKSGGKKSKSSKPVLPAVSAKKQTAMDKKRIQILLYELDSETTQKNIMDNVIKVTKHDDLDKRQVLMQQRNEHVRNIIAIQQELARHGINAGNTGN